MSAVTNPAPEAVYQSQRNGIERNNPYYFNGLTPNASYTLRLHFAEINPTAGWNSKRFHVIVNGDTVLKMFDIYAAAGGRYKAIVREFPVTASSTGKVAVKFDIYTGTSSVNGMEIVVNSSGGASRIAKSVYDIEAPEVQKNSLGRAVLTVYPNPVSDKINFRLSDYHYQNESLQIELVRLDGKKVLVTRINSNKGTSLYKVDTERTLAPGIYLLKVSGKELNVVTKIIVL